MRVRSDKKKPGGGHSGENTISTFNTRGVDKEKREIQGGWGGGGPLAQNFWKRGTTLPKNTRTKEELRAGFEKEINEKENRPYFTFPNYLKATERGEMY